MELLTVKQISYALRISEKGVYTRIYTNKIKAKTKIGRVNLFQLNQFVKDVELICVTETFYIYESKLNTMEL